MLLPFLVAGRHAEAQGQEALKIIEEALKAARQIVESDSPVPLEEVNKCLKVLESVNQIEYPLDGDLLVKLRSKREKAREQELDGRSDSEKRLDASELARTKKEIEEIEKQIKKIDEENAKKILNRILDGALSFFGIELSAEREDLIRQLRDLYRQKQEIEKK